jgi:hypothetical protein
MREDKPTSSGNRVRQQMIMEKAIDSLVIEAILSNTALQLAAMVVRSSLLRSVPINRETERCAITDQGVGRPTLRGHLYWRMMKRESHQVLQMTTWINKWRAKQNWLMI